MNILVFSWRDPKHPSAGGAEQVMHEHMKGWIASGHKVTLFSSRIKDLPKEEVIDGVKIIRRGTQYLGVHFEGFLFYLKNRKSIDLVVDQFHGIPFFTPLYVRKPILAVVQEVAGKVWLKNDLPTPFNWIVGLLGFISEPFIFLLYKKIPFISKKQTIFMVGSQSAKNSLIKMHVLANSITVIPHGVILPKKRVVYPKEKIPTILFFGAISKDKGILDALEVFNLLNNQANYKFWIAGRASEYYKKLVKNKAEKKGFAKNLKTWFGYVSEDKKFELMTKTHILINPSILEGWGLVNIEANAMGTPVVAYNSPGLVDSVKDRKSGIVCKINTPQNLVNVINKTLKNHHLYLNLQKGAIMWSRNFSWGKSRKLSLQLILSIMDKK